MSKWPMLTERTLTDLAGYRFIPRRGVTNPSDYGPCADDMEVALWSKRYLKNHIVKYYDLVGFQNLMDIQRFEEWDKIRETFEWQNTDVIMPGDPKFKLFPTFRDMMNDIDKGDVLIPMRSRVKFEVPMDPRTQMDLWIWFRTNCNTIPYFVSGNRDPEHFDIVFRHESDAIAFKMLIDTDDIVNRVPGALKSVLEKSNDTGWIDAIGQPVADPIPF